MGRRAKKKTALGQRIIEGLTELVETVERGEPIEKKFTVRTVELHLKPGEYDGEAVRATRSKLGVSQAVFAQILGASAEAIQAWEQGVRKPSPMACRLLDEINRDRSRWLKLLKSALRDRETADT